ncbi:DUF2087 domain-containing protein [Ideonella sp. A 288]|uniref:DUF2087 domain-containing protein n=1 Tax=Ideonella sp. A 288 TaxID=1962181 RepID=UPI000B4B8BD4|nr:DUF2087 domain-containing protein [Ideonella sp. A 288]
MSNDPLQPLADLVVKDGVGLGGLTPALRGKALALVWAGMPPTVMDERAVNVALKHLLAGAASFIDTDHVELRRWLVDAGWLWRDGFGREYRRVDPGGVPEADRSLAQALAAIDVGAWAASQRQAREAERLARRAAWQARQGGPA